MTKAEEGGNAVANYGQVIFEILDQAEKPDSEALPYLFNDMAEVNQSQETSIENHTEVSEQTAKFDAILNTQNQFYMSILQGRQKVVPNKRPGEPAKPLLMSMALYRFKG